MRPTRDLRRLAGSEQKHLVRLRQRVQVALIGPDARQRELVIALTTIGLLSTWANFVRAYYLSCLFGTRTGSRLSISSATPALSEFDAIGRAVRYWRPSARPRAGQWHRRDEPSWFNPDAVGPVLANEGVSSARLFAGAFSHSVNVTITQLPVFRNFYAHRNQQTEAAALGLAPGFGIPAARSPSAVLAARARRRPQPLLLDWIDDIDALVGYLCA